jgi:protein SCO1/2
LKNWTIKIGNKFRGLPEKINKKFEQFVAINLALGNSILPGFNGRLPLSLLFFSVACLGLITACFTPPYTFTGSKLDPPNPLPDFELMTTGGRPFQLRENAGDLTLIFFGYTACPDVCPLTLAAVKQALAGLEPGRVRVVMITVDPERDTPEILSRYLAAFDPGYVGLTGPPAQIEAAKAAFGVFAEKETVADSAAPYLISHTARLFVVDGQGQLSLIYSVDFDPTDLARDLNQLLQAG